MSGASAAERHRPLWRSLGYSCVACCAAETATLPVDTAKTRMQVGAGREGAVAVLRRIAAAEGVAAWWSGLAPALLRQSLYGSVRYGAYEPLKRAIGGDGLAAGLAAGTASGALSSALCTPADVVKVRLQASTYYASGRRGPYGGLWRALADTWRAEGVRGLYRGMAPTACRASAGAAAELACYDEANRRIAGRWAGARGARLHLAASLCAGFVAAAVMAPFDVLKSRVMNSEPAVGMRRCLVESVRAEGVGCLWRGFWPSYARVGPRVVIIFTLLEQMRARLG